MNKQIEALDKRISDQIDGCGFGGVDQGVCDVCETLKAAQVALHRLIEYRERERAVAIRFGLFLNSCRSDDQRHWLEETRKAYKIWHEADLKRGE